MLDFTSARLHQTIVHRVGMPGSGDFALSSETLDTSDEPLGSLLRSYFLGGFKGGGFYSFAHGDGIVEQNTLFAHCASFFEGAAGFVEVSRAIAEHLGRVSAHPFAKGGELYVASLKDCVVDGEMADALGIFKSETKDRFIRVSSRGDELTVFCELGTNPKKLDKGCIVFNVEKELGYKLSVIDTTALRGDEPKGWIDGFFGAKMRNDDFYRTKTAIHLCRGFVADVIRPENSFAKLEQAEMLAKARDFFKSNETFSQGDFEATVIAEPEVVEAFREYKRSYEAEQGYAIPDGFKISVDAARQSGKFLKSVIKLDRSFHIYIHGKQERVERGYDREKDLHYYKLYFEEES